MSLGTGSERKDQNLLEWIVIETAILFRLRAGTL